MLQRLGAGAVVVVVALLLIGTALHLDILPITIATYDQDVPGKDKVKNECSYMCDEWKDRNGTRSLSRAVEYCTDRFRVDMNDDGRVNQIHGEANNKYCENGIHCFNVHTCRKDSVELTPEKCRQLMCDYFTEIQGDSSNLSEDENVHDRIAQYFEATNDERYGVGTCGLANVSSWYNTDKAPYDFYQGDTGQPGGNPRIVCKGSE